MREHRLRALEDPGHRVVVARRQRVELVIVAAAQPIVRPRKTRPVVSSCSSTMSICCFTGSSSASILGPIARNPVATISSSRRAGSDSASRSPAICSSRNRLNGLSALNERDHVIAIAPGVGIGEVVVHAVGVGVADDVQPVPAPALAVSRRREQPVDDALERLRRIVAQERVDLFERRRNPQQVERRPPEERPLVGRRRGMQPGGLEPCQDEPVDRRSRPSPRRRPSAAWVPRHPKRPELPRGSGHRGTVPPSATGVEDVARKRARGPHLDPGGERLDLGRRELLLGRHRDVAFVADGEDQQALGGFAADDGRTGYAAFQERLQRVHAQIRLALARIGAVTAKALLGQDRTDLVLEEGDPPGQRRIRTAGRHRTGQKQDEHHPPGQMPRIGGFY